MIAKKKLIKIGKIALMAGIAIAFLYQQNFDLETTRYEIVDAKIPPEFSGYRIVHLSDLHNTRFGGKQRYLLDKIKAAQPDIIVITGDLIDSYHTNITIAMELIEGAIDIAPVYFVNGNHEARLGNVEELMRRLEASGVIILNDRGIQLERGNSFIDLIGLNDPSAFLANDYDVEGDSSLREKLDLLTKDSTGYSILLSHHPELLNVYGDYPIDLVFSGHAHGGQVRIPYVMDGLVAPNQGIFPKYTQGIYQDRNTRLIVSRGLGNSILPLRIFNRPEVVVVTLNPKE